MSESPTKLEVLGIAGSLRRASYNRAMLRAAAELAPAAVNVTPFGLHQIPLFNEDVEKEGDPEPVANLKSAIGTADALFIATPEYNLGIPGVLKNAVDWASRPPGRSVLAGKPVAIAGATPGRGGTIRAQESLRSSLRGTGALVLPRPELLIAQAHERFGDGGALDHEGTRKVLERLLQALLEWTETVGRSPSSPS